MRYLSGTITAMLLAATVPAAASARTAWFYERQLIPQGETLEETRENLNEAIQLILEANRE